MKSAGVFCSLVGVFRGVDEGSRSRSIDPWIVVPDPGPYPRAVRGSAINYRFLNLPAWTVTLTSFTLCSLLSLNAFWAALFCSFLFAALFISPPPPPLIGVPVLLDLRRDADVAVVVLVVRRELAGISSSSEEPVMPEMTFRNRNIPCSSQRKDVETHHFHLPLLSY